MGEESLCRLCAEHRPNADLIKIKDEIGLNLNLEYKIEHCFQLKIDENDKLPKRVCTKCCEKIQIIWEFNERVQKAQITLLTAINVQLKNESEDIQQDSNDSVDNEMVECLLETLSEDQHDDAIETGNKTKRKNEVQNLNKTKQKHSKRRNVRLKGRKKGQNDHSKNNHKSDSDKEQTIDLSNAKINEEDGSVNFLEPKEGWDSYPWMCEECGEQLKTTISLKDHFSSAHNQPPRYACVDCPKTYSVYHGFIAHVRCHRSQLKFCCDICSKFYSKKSLLDQHRQTHSDSRPYTCATCGKSFRLQSSLLYHSRIHLPEEDKNKYQCDVCLKKFGTKPNLMAHKRIHSGIKEFTCDQCGKGFFQKGNLDNHLLTHTALRPFSCNACGKTFKTVIRLKKHESVHSGLKPHQCDVCGRQFRERGTLKEHHRIHTGAMPYSCEFCGKLFRFKGVLTTHRRQHTGERPYSCVECQHHFTNWPNYNKHMKRRHGIDTSTNVRKGRGKVEVTVDNDPPAPPSETSSGATPVPVGLTITPAGQQALHQHQIMQHAVVVPDSDSIQSSSELSGNETAITYFNSFGNLANQNAIAALRNDKTVSIGPVLEMHASHGNYFMPGIINLLQAVDPSQLVTQQK